MTVITHYPEIDTIRDRIFKELKLKGNLEVMDSWITANENEIRFSGILHEGSVFPDFIVKVWVEDKTTWISGKIKWT